MDEHRQPKRGAIAAIAAIAGILGWFLFVQAVLGDFATHRRTKNELAVIQSKLDQNGLALKKSRDQLAPFFAFAAEHFPGADPDQQLEKLRDYFATAKLPPMRRHIDPAATGRLTALLRDAPALDVEITGPGNDPEALALASEFRKLFESAGMKVRNVTEYSRPPNSHAGVSVYSKPELDEALGNIIGEIFAAIAQEKIQWEKETVTANKRDPDMRIIVGPK